MKDNGIYYIDKPAKQIIKDMKVLEIFRKYIEVDYDEDGSLNVWGFSGIDLQDLSPEELKKVMEWINEG